MKKLWQDKDIRTGLRLVHNASKRKWMVGYASHIPGEPFKYTLNSMRDGLVVLVGSMEDLLGILNDRFGCGYSRDRKEGDQ